ncbi:MAG: hypothetical protein FJ288_12115 [Planctomycetes bacterium]|nr:hypothetical protein [Planctomycetota bacterium]
MPAIEEPSLLARRVRAAAAAGWWTLLAGALATFATGILCLLVVQTPLVRLVTALWGTPPQVVRLVCIAFVGLLKFALMLWALGCLFLSIWAYRLRRIDSR